MRTNFTRFAILTAFISLPFLSSAQGNWDSVATAGFGNPSAINNYVMDSLNGEIYVASTGNSMGNNYIYRSSTGAYGTWSNDPAYMALVGTMVNKVTSMATTTLGGGSLFAGADMYPNGVQVFQTDGSTWTQFGTIPYTPPPANFYTVSAMTFFTQSGSNDTLYAALENGTDGAELWKTKYNDPTGWALAYDFVNGAGKILDLKVWNNKLYAVSNYGWLWESSDGMNWTMNAGVGTNFGDFNNQIHRLEIFNGELYLGVDNNVTGTQLYKTNDGVNWVMVNGDGFNNPGNVFRCTDMRAAYGKLWILSEAYSAGGNFADPNVQHGGSYWSYVHYSSDGVNFTMDINNGFDTAALVSHMFQNMCLMGFNNHVFASGTNYAGAEVWSTCIAPTVDIGPDVTTCSDSLVLYSSVTGGVSPYSYLWSCGTVYDTVLYAPPTNGPVSIIVTDAGGCNAYDTLIVTVVPPPTISGNVTDNSGPVNNGWVYLVYMDGLPEHQYVVDSASISAGGAYSFFNYMDTGNYLVYAVADTLVYPNTVKTYHDSTYKWQLSPVINAQCSQTITGTDIKVITLSTATGQGSMSGMVKEGPGYQRFINTPGVLQPGDPVPDIDVSLEQSPGIIKYNTHTNANGQYAFTGVLPGTYNVYVDIPGLGMVSQYTQTIVTTENFVNLDYIVDSTQIYIDPNAGVGLLTPGQADLSIYPNPSKGNFNIAYTSEKEAQVSLQVFDLLGNIVCTLYNGTQSAGEHKYTFNPADHNLLKGVYFLKLSVDGSVQTRRMVSIQ